MPVPKRKKSKSRRDMRRSSHKLTATNPSACPNCQAPKLPHCVCSNCGQYKKIDVLHLEEGF
ncbi:MAG: 50S ribosomal protein L32 [Deltaproteobacteria bacterium]|nr:50S ribosomal protein L32 [Deltaproteobacteria bacterium]